MDVTLYEENVKREMRRVCESGRWRWLSGFSETSDSKICYFPVIWADRGSRGRGVFMVFGRELF